MLGLVLEVDGRAGLDAAAGGDLVLLCAVAQLHYIA